MMHADLFVCYSPLLTEDAIGVSRVPIAKKAKGNPGAGVIEVNVDTSGWKAKAVIDPDGNGSSSTWNFKGGESVEAKAKLMAKVDGAKSPWKRMVDGDTVSPGAGGGAALTDGPIMGGRGDRPRAPGASPPAADAK